MRKSDMTTRESRTVVITEHSSQRMAVGDTNMREFYILLLVTEVVGLVKVVMTAVWMASYKGGFAWHSNPHLEFNWHPVFYTIGLVYLFANSILVFRALRTLAKNKLKLIHTGIHTAVVTLSILGLVTVLDSKNLPPKKIPNFYSFHSWMGIFTTAVYVLQWLVSIAAFLYPGFPMSVRGMIMPIHVFLGLSVFVLAVATACTGITEKALSTTGYKTFIGETYFINFLGGLFIVFAVLVLYLATNSKYKRHPIPKDNGALFQFHSSR